MPAVESKKMRSLTSDVLATLVAANDAIALDEIYKLLPKSPAVEIRAAVMRLLDRQEAKLTSDNKVKADREKIKERELRGQPT